MTAPTAEQPPEQASQRSRNADGEDHTAPEPPKLRRRPMLIAASVLLTALGALLGAWLLTGLSGTKSYIAVGKDIERGQVIKETDLARTQLRTDAAVSPLLWEESRFVVGEHASVDMAKGSLVARDSVQQELIPGERKAVVGLALVPGQTVAGDLRRGDPVEAVIVPPTAEPGAAQTSVDGTVVAVKMSDDGTTKLVDVEVSVAENKPKTLSAAAARQEVALVVTSTDDPDDSSSSD